jgi:2'-5' RNA ligase
MSQRSERQIRAFVALPVPPAISQALADVQTVVRKHLPGGTAEAWEPELAGFHITLRFLGDLLPSQLEDLKLVNLTEQRRLPAGRRTKPFNLAAGGLGTFPYDGPPRILYASVTEDLARLHCLQIRVDELAKEAGFPPADFSFHPHITLGKFNRNLNHREAQGLAVARKGPLATAGISHPASWTVTNCCIMQNVRTRPGAEYRIVSQTPFLTAREAAQTPA